MNSMFNKPYCDEILNWERILDYYLDVQVLIHKTFKHVVSESKSYGFRNSTIHEKRLSICVN